MKRLPFDTLLIANRGEIAIRINRTAKRLGYRTIAVYSESDSRSPHRHVTDQAMYIGASQPAASYLNAAALIKAAKASGAQAVHPGYGFLAEDATFAQNCKDAGLIFIGPSSQAILSMGNKAEAKRLMAQAGVPCVPGYQGDAQSDSDMQRAASQIGYPIMIKAAAGGGGRGMRCVHHEDDFLVALHSAQSEAEHAFSSRQMILEKALVAPRHIEVQIIADSNGNVVHLGERDCSVQRRHQKLIEESPSPAVGPGLRACMGEISIAAARAIDYVGVATLEFLLDKDGQFYFMEMNTRLQVEHAVTESLTGIDLVEWQLRIASGESIPWTQTHIDQALARGGHAIEVRLCAEDTEQDFLPQSGQIEFWRAPENVRCDHALVSGLTVSPYYDSMLAKIIAHGSDRRDAMRCLTRALQDCVLLGIKNNRQFLAECIAQPEFIGGSANTGFIQQNFPVIATPAKPDQDQELIRVASLLVTWRRRSMTPTRFPDELYAWSSSVVYPQLCRFLLNGIHVETRVSTQSVNAWSVSHENITTPLCVHELDANRLSVQMGERVVQLDYAFDSASGSTCYFRFNGIDHTVIDTTYTKATHNNNVSHHGRISAPMNGRIVVLAVQQGDLVTTGQMLMVIEAMKMEHNIVAPCAGVLQTVRATIGEQVAPGRLLMEIISTTDL